MADTASTTRKSATAKDTTPDQAVVDDRLGVIFFARRPGHQFKQSARPWPTVLRVHDLQNANAQPHQRARRWSSQRAIARLAVRWNHMLEVMPVMPPIEYAANCAPPASGMNL